MRKKKKQYDDDDGRVIAPMNVEGMPWYVNERSKQPEKSEKIKLTKEENRAFVRGVLFAILISCGVFVVAFTLSLLFCDFVWLR